MRRRITIRIEAICTAFVVLITAFLMFPSFLIKANAAQDMMLNINKTELQKVGTQNLGGNACACYATAYCRTILDGYAHSWYEYDANNGDNGESDTWCMWGQGNYYKGYTASQLSLFQQAYKSLNSGRPFIIHVYNPTGTQGNEHWVTIVGYTGVSDYNSLNSNNFIIIDPASSSTLTLPIVLGSSKWALLLTDGYEYCYTNSGSANNNVAFFDFWGVENEIIVNDTYKIWFKQVGLGDRSNSDVNLYIDGKEVSNCLGTIYQDEGGFFSFELDTTKYSSGQHTIYAVFRNTSGKEIWVSRDLIFEKDYFFDFWGVDNGVTVGDEYKIWLKQVGLGDSSNSDVNIYIDGKSGKNHLSTLYQDESGYFSYNLNTIAYENGEHTIYAVFRNTAGKEIWAERTINIDSSSIFGFWGVDDGVTVNGTYKVWFKQVGLGDRSNSDVNIYIDGKSKEKHLATLYQDEDGFYSYELNTLDYANGEHILYAVFRNTNNIEVWRSKTIKIGNPDIAIDHLSGGVGTINIAGWIADGVDWTSSCEAYIYVGDDCISHFVANTASDDVGNHRYSKVIETKYYGDITLKIDAVDPVRGTIRTVYRDVTVDYLDGDCNNDGAFNISDVVLIQKWLLGRTKSLENWKAADLCKDGKLDVFDMCLLRRKLIYG